MKPANFVIGLILAAHSMVLGGDTLTVVSSIPDFGAIAREIGGTRIAVHALCRGTEDPHFVDPRPSFARLLNTADLLLEGGVGLEDGWLPALLRDARNPKILRGAPGNLVMATGIEMLEVPTGWIDRSLGDVHPFGNPHFWLGPKNAAIMARHITDKLCALDPDHADYYRSNLVRFEAELTRELAEWHACLDPWRGTRVVTYHKSFEYFAAEFGFQITGTLEPKPGIEPTPGHVKQLVQQMQHENVRLILIENFRPRKLPASVARSTGAKLVVVPVMVGGEPGIDRYTELIDTIVTRIANALSTNAPAQSEQK